MSNSHALTNENNNSSGHRERASYEFKWLPKLILLICLLSLAAIGCLPWSFFNDVWYRGVEYNLFGISVGFYATWLLLNAVVIWVLALGCLIFLPKDDLNFLSQQPPLQRRQNFRARRRLRGCLHDMLWGTVLLILTGIPNLFYWFSAWCYDDLDCEYKS